MADISKRLESQYKDVAQTIESQGLGYALQHYLTPDTDDEELNEAIRNAEESMRTIERIVYPYMFY